MVVFHHEQTPACESGDALVNAERFIGDGEGNRQMKRRPLARFALDPDPASHQFGQALADDESQTGAAILARGRTVHLSEGAKQKLLFVSRDADAGVADREMDGSRRISEAAGWKYPVAR